jgi:hypothetical protein
MAGNSKGPFFSVPPVQTPGQSTLANYIVFSMFFLALELEVLKNLAPYLCRQWYYKNQLFNLIWPLTQVRLMTVDVQA